MTAQLLIVDDEESLLEFISLLFQQEGYRVTTAPSVTAARERLAQGDAFDPEKHNAMSAVETAEVAPGSVFQLFQKGYLLNEQLLRPALVSVAKQD